MNIGWNCHRLSHDGHSRIVGECRNRYNSWSRLNIFRNVRGTTDWTKIIVTKKASVPYRSCNNFLFTRVARSVGFPVCSQLANVAFWTHSSCEIWTSSHANAIVIRGLEGPPPDASHWGTKAILGSLAPQAGMVNMSVSIRVGACIEPSKVTSNHVVCSGALRTIRDV